ncbi:MAG: 50S ribosomal protein L25 [Acidimicrobiia bacterium]
MATDQITLTAETGRPTGTRASRRLRAEGKIPGVVYGLDSEPKAVAVAWSELRAALTTDAGMNALIDLDVDGQKNLTMVYDMQRHPVRREVTHVDFILVDVNKTVDVDVPIVLEGTEEADHLAGLVIDQQLFSLPISAKPGTIPNELVVSVEKLTVDDPIRVGDLDLPEGVELNVDPEEAIVTASVPQVELPEPAEGEEAEGEGEAAEGEDTAEAEAEGGDAEAAAEGGEEA